MFSRIINQNTMKSLPDAQILHIDSQKNQLRVDQFGQVLLKLVDQRERNIGRIWIEPKGIVYEKEEKKNGIFKKLDAWSIPSPLVKLVDFVKINYLQKEYWIQKETINQKGRYMQFNGAGLELKVYVPRKEFKVLKRRTRIVGKM